MDKKKPSTLRRLLSYLKPQAFFVVLSFVLSAASVGLTLAIPVLIGRAVDFIIGPENVDFAAITAIVIKMAAVIAATAVCQWCGNLINNSISMGTARRLRTEVVEHLHRLPISYLDRHPHGDILSRAVTDIEQISDGLLLGSTQLFSGVLTILVTLVLMLLADPLITLIVVALTPVSFLVARYVAKNSRKMFEEQAKARGKLTAYTEERISNIKLVGVFGSQDEVCAGHDRINEELRGFSLRATFYSSLVNPSTRLIHAAIYAAVAAFGGFAVMGARMSVGMLVTFLGYTNQYSKPFNEITGVITEFQNAMAGAERVFELLDEKPESDEGKIGEMEEKCRSIGFDHVNFSYDPEKPLIRDFNVCIPAGKKAAIVGPTGCGKTTMINLIMRFYDADSGKICLDDVPVDDLKRTELRNQFAMVLQDTWLKTDTIRNNIAYGRPDASFEEIEKAAKEAAADDFIRKLPDGYDTVITDDGSISAGERQLICIARVMLDPPQMLILDEATSSIDSLTEQRITNDFDKIMQGRTSLIVAHRLSTIKSADVIIAMKDGQIIEKGTHRELLEKGGFYADLFNSQYNVG